jgi:sulfur-oxidizing protein SoxZ
MNLNQQPRIWISNAKPRQGEKVRVRAQIEHIMESGLRTDAQGNVRPRHMVTRFEAHLGDELLVTWEPGVSVAQDPYIEFAFLARASGELRLRWEDDTGQSIVASRAISVA